MEGSLLLSIGNYKLNLHVSILTWLFVCMAVTILLVIVGKKFKHADPSVPPQGILLVFEEYVRMTQAVIKGNLKEKSWQYLPLFGTSMLVMVICNLLGLVGLQTPTSNISVNMTLSIMVFLLIHITDIYKHGVIGKIKSLASPMVILFPLNIIGDLAFPVSLTLRLFGNMLGGSVIVALLYMLVKALLPYSVVGYTVLPFLHMYFDVFAAFMQTYIYFTLATFFLGSSLED